MALTDARTLLPVGLSEEALPRSSRRPDTRGSATPSRRSQSSRSGGVLMGGRG